MSDENDSPLERRQTHRRADDTPEPSARAVTAMNAITVHLDAIEAKLDQESSDRADAIRKQARAESAKRRRGQLATLAVLCLFLIPGALFINAHRNAIDRIQDVRANTQKVSCDSYNTDVAARINRVLTNATQPSPERPRTAEQQTAVDTFLADNLLPLRNCTPAGIADYYATPRGPNAYQTAPGG